MTALLPSWLVAGAALAATAAPPIRYDVRVTVEPGTHRIAGTVDVELGPTRPESKSVEFVLHAGLTVVGHDGYKVDTLYAPLDLERFGINEEGGGAPEVPLAGYRVTLPDDAGEDGRVRVPLTIGGTIHHPLTAEGEEYARSFSRTPGTIGPSGVFLAGGTYWLPWLGDELFSFRLDVTVPAGWDAVSQGERKAHEVVDGGRRVVWESPEPMEEAYLVAGRYHTWERPTGGARALVYLHADEPNLAARYLEATAQYVAMYEELLGPYPFTKFALVENFWESGYGMPSFTLLGPKVIRFPFILTSSYPHEILHNWWGNSVYVDYPSGNWCEGLTAYLADYLMKEGQGQGAGYRRDTLKRYTDYVRGGSDFPLAEFRSRHSSATEAVGYGKSLMLWHMVRRRIGDDAFVRGLQRFYREHKFRKASFTDLERAFSAAADQDLSRMFRQWVTRPGAPELALDADATRWDAASQTLTVVVHQRQSGRPFTLDVPIAISVEDEPNARLRSVRLQGPKATLHATLAAPPVEVAVDPEFDLFRRLDRNEIPPSLSELFGADRIALVLPSADGAIPAAAWQTVADAWSKGGEDIVVTRDDELAAWPNDRAVWLLGADNRWRDPAVAGGLAGYGAGVGADELRFGDGHENAPRADHAFVYVVRHPDNPERTVGWVGADRVDALPGLARKLPHYGKYSFLAFQGGEPSNVRKGQWPTLASPLVKRFGRGTSARLPAREPLTRPKPVFDPDALRGHVAALTAAEMEGRGVGTAGLNRAADYVAAAFREAGLEPAGDDGTFYQRFLAPNGPGGGPARLANVVGVLRGHKPEWSDQSVVVSAHYDHLGRGWPDVRTGNEGELHPGADDNASGVAVLLEVARLLAGSLQPDRTLVFVAFTGEEWDLKGSRHYVKATQTWPAEKALAMVNLDTVGRLGDRELMVLGAGTATEWIHIARGIGFTTGIQSKAVMDDPGGSDQKAFHEAGVPAVQLFAGAHDDYHRPSDTADKVDVGGLVKVATWLKAAVEYLAERDRPLTSKLGDGTAGQPPPAAASSGGRRVSLGTLPDFAFAGPGVRVEKVMPDTAAATAGLRDGDLLLAIDGEALADLRAYAAILRKHQPGDRIAIRLQRAGEELTLEATLRAR